MTLPPEKSRLKRDWNPGSSVLEAGALTTRPTRRLGKNRGKRDRGKRDRGKDRGKRADVRTEVREKR